MRTAIQGGDIVAFHAGGHRLLHDGVLVFESDRIVYVGRRYDGPVDARVDASSKLVMPGLINVHCHPTTEAGGRLIADVGRREYFHTGLNYTAAPPACLRDSRADKASAAASRSSIAPHGCTTVVPICSERGGS